MRRMRAARTRSALTQSYIDVKSSHKASRWKVVSCDRGHSAGRASCRQHRCGTQHRRLYQVRRPVNQMHTCLCREVPGDRRARKPGRCQAQRRQLRDALTGVSPRQALAGCTQMPRQELEAMTQRSYGLISLILWGHTALSLALSGPRGGWRRDGCYCNTRFAASASLLFSVQETRPTRSARSGRVFGKAASVSRAARGAACGKRRYVCQHVSKGDFEASGLHEGRYQRADSSKRMEKICHQKSKKQSQLQAQEQSQPQAREEHT